MISLDPLHNQEALDFWQSKVRLSPGQFAKLLDDEKTMAFSISGIAKSDMLETVFNAISSAIENGDTFAEFKGNIQSVIDARGWTGKAAWRIETIYRTNIQTAFNVGRYRQMMRVTNSRPFWRYNAVNDSRTRPTHRAMNGKIFRFDHPFWDKWYPPNGFRCRCSVRTLSQREIDRDGLTVETQDPTGGLVEPTTPEGIVMPARLLMPDPGFAHNPGKSAYAGVADDATGPVIWKDVPNLKGPDAFRRKKMENVRPADIPDLDSSMLLPGGETDDFYKAEFLSRYGQEKVITDAAGEPVILSLRACMADKAAGTWKFNKSGHGQMIPLMEGMIEEPFEIWLVPQRTENGRIRLTRRYICLWKTAAKNRVGGMAVYEVSGGVWQGVTSFLPMKKGKVDTNLNYVEKQRHGILLWGK
ncbi:minor capsid protein [Desulfosarcina sp. OttesenSCG-928-G10]|nr:minor capsid protein [Desulfosarcina sp. OttesenSCG-928-G10]